ncbi:alpha-L-arabinofuranosidase [Chitinophaga barathri]|uniref:Alpha-L-arabinofuranosidase n=1 Tax=Chitinophaga barathri TaxID=1647451 RepID=A0A3N4MPL0_9BACT|nr:alpha-L-arabinofuranosidase [Chitinophaga barathri]RPD42030.1 alpha-L-arabinofuranosidase [Chitinophaga barathri]
MKIARGIWLLSLVCTTAGACNKKNGGGNYNGGEQGADTSGTVIVTPADPATAGTIGFFMDGWMQRRFAAPAFTEKAPPSAAGYTVTVDASTVLTKISPVLFGNNTNIWMSQVVNQPKLINHLSKLQPGILRFPGGNNSSVYFWNKAPGQAPADAPAKLTDANGALIDAGYWFGGNTDDWTLSVDNYYRMLQLTGNEGIITVNYGYARYGTGADPVAAAAHLAADWVRADKGRTRYWEVGNESNGVWQAGYRIDPAQNKDGQPGIITGELYGKHFKVFADSMRKAAAENGKPIFIGAQLLEHEPANWATPTDREWNTGVLKQAGLPADYYIIHSYYTPFNTNSNPPEVLASAEAVTKAMADHITAATSAAGAPVKPLALTEWNIFAVGSQQMVSQVAGMHAVMVIGELMRNRYGLACRWDLANGWENGNDHGLFSQGEAASGEQKWDPRPAFYYLYYFRHCLGDRFINAEVSGSNSGINAYASTFSSGEAGVTLVNRSSSARDVQLAFKNFRPGSRYYWYVLTGGEGVSSFSRKVFVNGSGPTGQAGGPADYATLKAFSATAAQGVKVSLPPMSVVCMVIEAD